MEFSTINGAMRNCKYRGNSPLYVVQTPDGKFFCKTGPAGLNVGQAHPECNAGHTIARIL